MRACALTTHTHQYIEFRPRKKRAALVHFILDINSIFVRTLFVSGELSEPQILVNYLNLLGHLSKFIF